jgi:hypothetical protein
MVKKCPYFHISSVFGFEVATALVYDLCCFDTQTLPSLDTPSAVPLYAQKCGCFLLLLCPDG